jgi:hypothetical protein
LKSIRKDVTQALTGVEMQSRDAFLLGGVSFRLAA